MISPNTNLAGAESPGNASGSPAPNASSAADVPPNVNTNTATSPDLSQILAALATMQAGLEATSSATQVSLMELGDRLTAVELSGFQDACRAVSLLPKCQ